MKNLIAMIFINLLRVCFIGGLTYYCYDSAHQIGTAIVSSTIDYQVGVNLLFIIVNIIIAARSVGEIFNSLVEYASEDFLRDCENERNEEAFSALEQRGWRKYFLDRVRGLKISCSTGNQQLTERLLANCHGIWKYFLNKHSHELLRLASYERNRHVLAYLIYSYQVKESKAVKKFLGDNPDIAKMFESRNLKNHLQQVMPVNPTDTSCKKRSKI